MYQSLDHPRLDFSSTVNEQQFRVLKGWILDTARQIRPSYVISVITLISLEMSTFSNILLYFNSPLLMTLSFIFNILSSLIQMAIFIYLYIEYKHWRPVSNDIYLNLETGLPYINVEL
jgi:hypothetical protein